MKDIAFIPNEYAAEGVVMCHPKTSEQIRMHFDALRARNADLLDALNEIAAMVMKYDIEPMWEARVIASLPALPLIVRAPTANPLP